MVSQDWARDTFSADSKHTKRARAHVIHALLCWPWAWLHLLWEMLAQCYFEGLGSVGLEALGDLEKLRNERFTKSR